MPARKVTCNLLALSGQLAIMLAAANIASHNYAHHSSAYEFFLLSGDGVVLLWFRNTFQGASKTYESFGSGLK